MSLFMAGFGTKPQYNSICYNMILLCTDFSKDYIHIIEIVTVYHMKVSNCF